MAHPAPDLLALLALGEDADQSLLDHVSSCRPCTDEVHALQQVVAVGQSLGPQDRISAPHPRVWQRIASDVNDGRVIPLPGAVVLRERPVVPPAAPAPVPLGGVGEETRRSGEASEDRGHEDRARGAGRPRRRWFVPALAAAVALVAGLAGFGLRGVLDPAPSVVGVTQLNALPRFPGANGTATVEEDPDGQRTLVVSMEMPATAVADGRLEVWMTDSRATDMVPMGMMTALSGRFPVPAGMSLEGHPIVDVSLEPTDDADPAHSSVSVLRGRLKL